jgi:maltose alpha-D-glucosyltransferase/alpha-amylase
LIEVSFEDGLPETYHLPVTIVKGDLERKLRETCPQAFMAICNAGSACGMITDAFYTPELQQWLFKNLAANSVINLEQSVMHFIANDSLQKHVNENPEIISRVHSTDFKNTSITYDNTFFLKMYRKMDAGINPDVEITRHLTEDTNFSYVPAYLGSIEWMLEKETLSLGMMQVMVENHGDGKSFMMERVHNYIERILALNHGHDFNMEGSFTDPVSYEKIPTVLQNLMGGAASEQAALLGKRIAQLHATLALDSEKPSFQPEDFSVHYQRSLFSSMQSLVRESFQVIQKHSDKVEPEFQQQLKNWNTRKEEILTSLRRIYAKKIDALKTRIHGNLHLDQVLLTGKDIAIHDFGGDPYRHFGERRLKRSPLRDIASMIRSFYYVVYETILASNQIPKEEKLKILEYAPLWGHYMSNFFLHSYYEGVRGKSILPDSEEDLSVMLDSYLIQKALLALNGELMNRPDHVIIPLKLLEIAMGKIQERR